jgi:hypothetical protein
MDGSELHTRDIKAVRAVKPLHVTGPYVLLNQEGGL